MNSLHFEKQKGNAPVKKIVNVSDEGERMLRLIERIFPGTVVKTADGFLIDGTKALLSEKN